MFFQANVISDVSQERVYELTGCSYGCSFSSYSVSQRSSNAVEGYTIGAANHTDQERKINYNSFT